MAAAGSLFYDDPADDPAPWSTPMPPASGSAPRAAPGSTGGGSGGGGRALARLLQQRHQQEQQGQQLMYTGAYGQPQSPAASAGGGAAQQADGSGPAAAGAERPEQPAAAGQLEGSTEGQQHNGEQDEQPPVLDPAHPLCPHCWRLPSGTLRNHSSGIKVCPACNLHSRSNGGQLRHYTAEQRQQHAEQAQQALQQRDQQQAAAAAAAPQQAPAAQLPERRPKRKAAAAAGPSSAGSSGGRNAAAEVPPRSTVRQPKAVHHPRPTPQQAKRSRQPGNVYQALTDGGVDAALVHALFWRCTPGGLGDREAEWLLLMLERGDVAGIERLLRGPPGVLPQPAAAPAEAWHAAR